VIGSNGAYISVNGNGGEDMPEDEGTAEPEDEWDWEDWWEDWEPEDDWEWEEETEPPVSVVELYDCVPDEEVVGRDVYLAEEYGENLRMVTYTPNLCQCSEGCCRLYNWLTCDTGGNLPFIQCICNRNTRPIQTEQETVSIEEPSSTGDSGTIVDTTTMAITETEEPEEPEGTGEPEEAEEESSMTIVDLAVATSDLTTLVDLVIAAGLVDTLSGEGPFTVFAPTNDAFAALPAAVVESLTNPDNIDDLVSVLTYHVVPGLEILSTDLIEGAAVVSVNGGSLTVTSLDPDVTINESAVIAADILASNGVVHLIDTVLIPPSGTEEEEEQTAIDRTIDFIFP